MAADLAGGAAPRLAAEDARELVQPALEIGTVDLLVPARARPSVPAWPLTSLAGGLSRIARCRLWLSLRLHTPAFTVPSRR
jgi:hypothetical protein